MSSYPILNNKPIDQWKVTELKEELRRRRLPVSGLKEALVRKLDEALRKEMETDNGGNMNDTKAESEIEFIDEVVGGAPDIAADMNETRDDDGSSSPGNQCGQVEEPPKELNHEYMKTEAPALVEKTTATATLTFVTEVDPTLKCGAAVVSTEEIASSLIVETAQVIVEETTSAAMEETVPSVTEGTSSDFSMEVHGNANQSVTAENESAQASLTDDKHVDLKSHMEDVKYDLSSAVVENVNAKQAVTAYSAIGQDSLNEDNDNISKDVNLNLLLPENQVSVVSPDLGSQVKSESLPTDSMSIIEKNKLKDNLNANDFHIEQEVIKQEMVQPSSSSEPILPVGGDHHNNDDKELVKNRLYVEEVNCETVKSHDITVKEDSLDVGSPDKLNLDHSSGDESMEEDAVQSKHYGPSTEVGKPHNKEYTLDPITSLPNSANENSVQEQEIKPTADAMEKRKYEGPELLDKNENTKRQRRWNSETIKVPNRQVTTPVSPSLPKSEFQPNPRRTVTSFDQKSTGDSPKERIVPPSQNPATTSLRVDRFLRPFTLKAVQELLGGTGTICDFWMDHIKTHCYVTFSSVEEAIATRNAVYNLRWPVNGGNLLIAEFVDPKEVKERSASPQQAPVVPSPTAPITPNPTAPKAPYLQQHQSAQPPARQNSFRQQLPPPPPLSEKERLPPPPAPIKKPEPPPLTLDDLFFKTKATPRIYYLPLTDDQVKAKLAAQGKSIEK